MTTGTASPSDAGGAFAAPVRPGEVVAEKYRVEQTLGVGGMGVVVAATDEGLERRVAIKFLLPKLAGSETAAQRFVREARAATRITSEHVVRLLEIDKPAVAVSRKAQPAAVAPAPAPVSVPVAVAPSAAPLVAPTPPASPPASTRAQPATPRTVEVAAVSQRITRAVSPVRLVPVAAGALEPALATAPASSAARAPNKYASVSSASASTGPRLAWRARPRV